MADKVAIVTGAGRDMGRTHALALAVEGLMVIAASKAAKAGANFDELVNVIRNNIGRVDFRMAFA